MKPSVGRSAYPGGQTRSCQQYCDQRRGLNLLPILGPGNRSCGLCPAEPIISPRTALPKHPMTAVLIEELNTLAAEVGTNKVKDAVGTSCAALAVEDYLHERLIGTLLVEAAGEKRKRGRRGREAR